MRELCRTADPVKLSFVRALLTEAGIECQVLDEATSNLFGGAIQPRVVVADEDWFQASRVLINAPDLRLDD
jgi:hypothetical protein